ncbi:FkbM family methyltransferase [Carboxylicivirga marina]|uniref:FkbM family methyltransferase n=1 Tax=Carboxylicivirga marina TaxID=2800988 RepID=A0ABS1HLQ5_9BACT|nr:FkbM family methyltransferase [Carboxylicivirga marina]MBK3518561.1 FkbM family methyltransferase [Carboxylicivirga marina]
MLKKQLLHIYRALRGKSPFIKKSIHIESDWLGSKNGGFFVHTNLLKSDSIVYSFGIGEDISFDQQLMNQCKCTVHGFDPTPRSIDWVRKNVNSEQFIFEPLGISHESGNIDFFLPKNNAHVSGSLSSNSITDEQQKISVPVKTLADIVKDKQHQHIDLLKMDIEGAEYDVIPNILASGIEIKQVLVEFHHRLYPNGNNKTKNAIEQMKAHGYEVFAISDLTEEISFIKK